MLIFEFELADRSVTSFSFGHITVTFGELAISSKEGKPSQAMMIFPSVVTLLDGVRKFLSVSSDTRYEFIGVDSSFALLFHKTRDSTIQIRSKKTLLCVIEKKELICSLSESTSEFINAHLAKLSQAEPIRDDLVASRAEFEQLK